MPGPYLHTYLDLVLVLLVNELKWCVAHECLYPVARTDGGSWPRWWFEFSSREPEYRLSPSESVLPIDFWCSPCLWTDWKRALPPYLCLTTHIRSRQLAVSFSRWTPLYITPPYSPSHPRHVFKNHPSVTWTKLGRKLFAKTRCCNWLGLTTYIHTHGNFAFSACRVKNFPMSAAHLFFFFFCFLTNHLSSRVTDHSHLIIPIRMSWSLAMSRWKT